MFALDPTALADAGSRIDAVARTVAGVDVTGPLLESSPVPGSETADACLWLATRLDAALDAYADRLADLCETARLVARDAAATDLGVADLHRLPHLTTP